MKFEINKRARIPAAVLTSLLLILIIADVKVFFAARFTFDILLYIFCIVCSLITGVVLLFDVHYTNQHVEKVLNTSLFFLSPLITITMTECLNNIFIYDMTYLGFAGNYVVIIIFLFIVYVFSGSFRLPLLIVNPILFIFAVVNFYVKAFRGTPFLPMDFVSVKTGMNVMGEYSIEITHQVLTAIVLLSFLIVLGIKMKTPRHDTKQKIFFRTILGLVSLIILLTFYMTDFFANLGIRPDFWNQTRGYKRYGFVCSFFINTKYLFVTQPAGYDAEQAEGYMDEVLSGAEEKIVPDKKPGNQTPNIICIMNESLSDLSVLGDFETNIDYMPFLRSLTKNTIKGNLYVPVIGAGTSNTEYEFLTGNTTAFFPGGSNAYMLYMKSKAASMVSTLSAQNYYNAAFHPYYASGWNRVNVYDFFGFKQFKSLGNIIDLSIMQEYQKTNDAELLQQLVSEAYPNSDILLRTYVSDSYNYKVLIDDYENRDPSVPYHVFNVTMQNHGSYNKTTSNFKQEVWVTNMSKTYPLANQYLSLVKRSDDAFKELIEYFSKVEEPVIICMFGDHQPSIETQFVEELMGKSLSLLSVKEEQKRHTTQFYIWANYDIKEQEIEMMSANYLSSLVLKTAGSELTKYNKYLLELYKTLPVIDTAGYIDSRGNYYSWNQSSEYTQLLKKYEIIQYNNVFDKVNKKEELFYLK